ncbi:DUF1700 domain-containing protein [Pseudoxanthomonas winnipegensis]|uniref:DUF1700 domain-containing protein n=1 Tax=Pseudoxanthomonas winnipegensis TaxID=2480810 RepID=UPI0030F4B176
MTQSNSAATQAWLRRFRWALTSLPSSDREDITREIGSHIDDRIAQGLNEDQVLAALGAPDVCARGFLDDFALTQALTDQDVLTMVKAAMRWLTQSIAAFFGVLVAGCIGLFAIVIVLTVVMRLLDPVHWGLWLTARSLILGVVDDPSEGRELLGAWLYAWAVLGIVVCWAVGRTVLLASLRHVAKSLPSRTSIR